MGLNRQTALQLRRNEIDPSFSSLIRRERTCEGSREKRPSDQLRRGKSMIGAGAGRVEAVDCVGRVREAKSFKSA